MSTNPNRVRNPLYVTRIAAGQCMNCGLERGADGTTVRCRPCATASNEKTIIYKRNAQPTADDEWDGLEDGGALQTSGEAERTPYRRLAAALLSTAFEDLHHPMSCKSEYRAAYTESATAFLTRESPILQFWCDMAEVKVGDVVRAAQAKVSTT